MLSDFITLTNEKNQDIFYKCVFTFDFNKRTYAALMPLQYEIYHYSSLPDGSVVLSDVEDEMQQRCINYIQEYYDASMPVLQTFYHDHVKYEVRFIFTLDYEEYAVLFHEEFHLFRYEKNDFLSIENEMEYGQVADVFTALYRGLNNG